MPLCRWVPASFLVSFLPKQQDKHLNRAVCTLFCEVAHKMARQHVLLVIGAVMLAASVAADDELQMASLVDLQATVTNTFVQVPQSLLIDFYFNTSCNSTRPPLPAVTGNLTAAMIR